MNWSGKQHPVETVVEWLAPVPLALAVAWAGKSVGIGLAGVAAASIAALAAGFAAIKRIGGAGGAKPYGFEPTAFEGEAAQLGELLLEPKDEVLILDDPLVEVAPDSRVVRLFTRQEATPGELIERIADFLGDGRRMAPPTQASVQPGPPTDASAALYAALANIRASLR